MTLYIEAWLLSTAYQSASGSSIKIAPISYQVVLDFLNAYDGCAFE